MLDHFQNMSVLHRKVRGPQGPWMSLGAVVSSKRDADVIFFSMKFSVDLWLGHESASQLVSSCLEIPSCANLVGQRLFSVSTTRGREVSLCGCRCIHLVHGNAWMEAGKDCDLTEPNSQAKNLTFRHSKSSFFSKFCCFMSVKLIWYTVVNEKLAWNRRISVHASFSHAPNQHRLFMVDFCGSYLWAGHKILWFHWNIFKFFQVIWGSLILRHGPFSW